MLKGDSRLTGNTVPPQKWPAEADSVGPCQRCQVIGPLVGVTLRQNIGAFVARYQTEINGFFCRGCTHHYFWTRTLTTLCVGWWGLISFLVTPAILVSNTYQYTRAMRKFRAMRKGHQ